MNVITWPAKVVWIFFFQAEDGIRDRTVTGVQTCALPISDRDSWRRHSSSPSSSCSRSARWNSATASWRSEERRVGKECRCRWGTDHLKEKINVAETSCVAVGCGYAREA